MTSRVRVVLLTVVGLVVLVGLAIASLPLFLNADSFRVKIENSVSKSLGRKVTIGTLHLAVFSGGMLAENVTIADDPAYSAQPFVQAQSVKVRVALWPLITRREVQVGGFVLQSPQVTLLRGARGQWNYSSIGRAAGQPGARDAETQSTFPNLTVGKVEIENGRITVGQQAGAAAGPVVPSRVYDQVALTVSDFAFDKAFPFSASVHLPGQGTVDVKGKAGPINSSDASATPFSGDLTAKHIDPLAAGFVDAASGISGQIDSLVLDAAWSGQQMHVTKLNVDGPHLTIVKNNAPKTPKPANAEGSSMLESLAVDSAEVSNGSVTITTAGQTGQPSVYQNLHATLTNLTATTASPFTLGAQLPGGGSLNASGRVGPYNARNDIDTPLEAQVSLKHVELATSGVVAPDAGMGGLADIETKIVSDGRTLNANGTAHVDNIRLAKTGTPSRKPVDAQFAVVQNEQALTGDVQHATITVGRAAVNVAGTYQTSGPSTAINLKVNGQAMPIDELEAFLPALGVKLPSGSRLQGGTLTANLTVSGSTANPVISGPVRLDNTALAGFDLSSKLGALTRFTGAKPGSETQIRSLSMELVDQGPAIRTDRIALDMPALGTASGAGTVSGAGALDYHIILKPVLLGKELGSVTSAIPGGNTAAGGLAGQLLGSFGGGGGAASKSLSGLAGGALKNGIPVAIGGTTTNPTFTPDVRGLASTAGLGAVQGALGKRTASPDSRVVGDPVKTLGGLFGKHK